MLSDRPERRRIQWLLEHHEAASASAQRDRFRRSGAALLAVVATILMGAGVVAVWQTGRGAAQLTLQQAVTILHSDASPEQRRAAIEAIRRRVVNAEELLRREFAGDNPMLQAHARNALRSIAEGAK